MKFERNRDPMKSMGIGNYVHDNGFGARWYICNWTECKSTRMEMKVLGGFQPPEWICRDCGRKSGSPVWVSLFKLTGEPYSDNKVTYRDPVTNEIVNE